MRTLLALAFVALTAACGGSDEATDPPQLREGSVQVMSTERVLVDITVAAPMKLGKNELAVDFPSRPNTELYGVSALMPAHGHGSPAPAIERTDSGYLVHDLVLYMSGRWEVHFQIRVDGHEDEAVVVVDIP